jgi:hypothetical protein
MSELVREAVRHYDRRRGGTRSMPTAASAPKNVGFAKAMWSG